MLGLGKGCPKRPAPPTEAAGSHYTDCRLEARTSSVVDDYLPGILSAQERIEDADEADAESLEAAKTALIVEYVDELEKRLQSPLSKVMAESTESVFIKTIAPALHWRFPTLVRPSVCFGGSRWFRPLRPVRRY